MKQRTRVIIAKLIIVLAILAVVFLMPFLGGNITTQSEYILEFLDWLTFLSMEIIIGCAFYKLAIWVYMTFNPPYKANNEKAE